MFAWPHLLYRETPGRAGVVIALHLVSLVFMAPLEEMADPTRTPNPAKAPWYFLGLQELVHYSALIGGVVVPALIVVALARAALRRPPTRAGPAGGSPRSAGSPTRSSCAAVLLFAAFTVIGTFFRGPYWAWVWPWR